MSIEAILRCGLLKQHQQWAYEELAFHLTDSATSTAFARLPRGLYPTDSALQGAIALIRGETWERINRVLVKDALSSRVETLKQARIDSTVTETLIHKPWDSQLLGDAERVLERLMTEACEHTPRLRYTCHHRAVKKQIMAIRNCKGEEKRREHYRKLIGSVRHTLRAVHTAMATGQQTRAGCIVPNTMRGWPCASSTKPYGASSRERKSPPPTKWSRVRTAHRYRRQRPARHPVWTQAQSHHGQTRHGSGCRDRRRQPGG